MSGTPADPSPSRQDLIGDILVGRGLLTAEQFAECRASFLAARNVGVKTSLLKVVRDKGYLSAEQEREVRRELVRRGVLPRLGEYELLERIGAGGMGAVYKARHPRLDTVVALKVLLPEVAANRTFVERFEREARLAARLGSGIVHIMDVQQAAGRHFIVMEYVEGESVGDRLAREGRIAEPEALRIVRDAARALHAAHEKGIVHRDVKPSNILLAASGEVKLTDLGLAKDLGAADASLTHSGAGMGSPHYIAPEQVKDAKSVDPRADVYSLGATLYHMLAGRPPFLGNTAYEVMIQHATRPIEDPARLVPSLSAGTADLVRRMMAKSPDRRIQTAGEVAEEADRLLRALEAGTSPPASRRRLSRRRVAALGGAGALTLAMVLVLARSAGPPPETRPSVPRGLPPADVIEPIPLVPEPAEPEVGPDGPSPSAPGPRPETAPVPKRRLFDAPALPPLSRTTLFRCPPQRILDIAAGPATGGEVWCAIETGAAAYDSRTGRWRYYDLPFDAEGGNAPRRPYEVAVDGAGRAWLAGSGFVALLSRDDARWEVRRLLDAQGRPFYFRIGFGGENRLCAVASDGVFVLQGDAFAAHPSPEDLGPPLAVAASPEGTLFAAMRKGVLVFENGTCRAVKWPASWAAGPAKAWALAAADDACWLSVSGLPRDADGQEQDGLWVLRGGRVERPVRDRPALARLVGPLVSHPSGRRGVAGRSLLSFDARSADGAAFTPWDEAVCDASGAVYAVRRASAPELSGLRRLDGRDGERIEPQADLPAPAHAVATGGDGSVWAATERGVARFDGAAWRAFDAAAEPVFRGRESVADVAWTPDGTVFALANDEDPAPSGAAPRLRALLRGSPPTVSLLAWRKGRWEGPLGQVAIVNAHLAVDGAGAVWVFGAAGGVSRFDGKAWTHWTTAQGLQANGGSLAAGARSERAVFVPLRRPAVQIFEAGRWTTVPLGADVAADAVSSAHLAALDARGDPWLWAARPAALVHVRGRDVHLYPAADDALPRVGTAMAFDPEGRLWIGYAALGLSCFDGAMATHFTGGRGLPGSRVEDLAFAPDAVWAVCDGSLVRLSFEGGASPGRN